MLIKMSSLLPPNMSTDPFLMSADDAVLFGQTVTLSWLPLGIFLDMDIFMILMAIVSLLHFHEYLLEPIVQIFPEEWLSE